MMKGRKNKKQKGSGKNDGDNSTISLKDGWERIYNVGVKPFFDRVERVDDEEAFDKTSIPQQQYS